MGIASKIKKELSDKGNHNEAWEMLYYRCKYAAASFLGKIWSEEHYAQWFYHLFTGKHLNLQSPKYFDEKIWWLKLHNRDPLLTKCSDKYAVREYVKECDYENILIPQYAVLDSVKQLDFDKYHEEIVVKCTHNSGGHVFYDPRKPLTKKQEKTAKKRLKFILKHNASVLSHEWNYKNIPPRIIVEKVIRNANGELPILFTSIGRWWGTNPVTHSQEEIDLVANDGKDYIFGECKWRNDKTDLSVLCELKAKADIFSKNKNNTYYALFSKSGFTDAVINEAKSDSSIILADLNEIMNF